MLKMFAATALLAAAATSASAHEIWLERHGDAVRVYVGDATGERDSGETLAKLASTSRLFGEDRGGAISVTAQAEYLTATFAGHGDLRYYNDQVWAPWKAKDGVTEAAAFQARAGRKDSRAVHDFELVPVQGAGDRFTLMFKGQPMAQTGVTIINPELWEKTIKTDAIGRLTVPVSAKGQYILVARHTAPAEVEIAGQKVARLQHVASLSFVAD